jgi:hypothetical protein
VPVLGAFEIIPPVEEKISEGVLMKTSIRRRSGPSAVIGRTQFESVLIASAVFGVQIGDKLALMAPRRT